MRLPEINRLNAARCAGRVPFGHMIVEFPTIRTGRMLADCGLDFVILDMEHTAHSIETIAACLTGFFGAPVSPFVRVPVAEYHFIARVLDAGASGVMVPDVQDAAHARAIVAATKYEPIGRRGVFLGGALTHFHAVDAKTFMVAANDATGVICQIESLAGINHAEEIAAVHGVDVLWIGHNDLTRSLGIPGKFDHPDFRAAFQRVAAAARAHGLGVGAQPRDAAQAAEFLSLGADVLSCSSDVFLYRDALRDGISSLRALPKS